MLATVVHVALVAIAAAQLAVAQSRPRAVRPCTADTEKRRKWSVASELEFSTVTLTTVGFGDVVPVTPAARLVTGLEAMVGQLLLGGRDRNACWASRRPESVTPVCLRSVDRNGLERVAHGRDRVRRGWHSSGRGCDSHRLHS